jgi:hypothetical protein
VRALHYWDGSIAEERFCGKATPSLRLGAEGDYGHALDWASVIVAEDELEAHLAWLAIRARDLVELWWPQIEVVAEALIERQRLSGPDTRRVIRESMDIA